MTTKQQTVTPVVIDQGEEEELPLVLQDLYKYLNNHNDTDTTTMKDTAPRGTFSSSLFDKSSTAVPVAAIKALVGVVQRSSAETMMGLQDELKSAVQLIVSHKTTATATTQSQSQQQQSTNNTTHRSYSIALQSGCELFLRYVTRTFLELPNFEQTRQDIMERGKRFEMISLTARDQIATLAADFVRNNTTILTLGWSRVVASILLQAWKHNNLHFDVIILEGKTNSGTSCNSSSGIEAAKCYARETNIPVTVAPDAAMAYIMENVDMVLTGAEGVVENGGVVNQVGTYTLATCAHAQGKPFYVAVESYKFARLYPLSQSDIPQPTSSAVFDNNHANHHPSSSDTDQSMGGTRKHSIGDEDDEYNYIKFENPAVDFTPGNLITLLFTDLGVLTPSAVSDELIRLYQ